MFRPHPVRPARRSGGLTLMELLIALAVLAVVLGLAAPSMQSLLLQAQLRSEGSRLLNAVQLARSEAAARFRPVSICPAVQAAAGELRCGGTYGDGWLVLEGLPQDAVIEPARLLRLYHSVPDGYRVADRAGADAVGAFTYYPDGATRRNLTLSVCSRQRPDLAGWSVVINRVGRARLARDWGRCEAV
ncbi:GspH/FimT family pseudopilin [Parahaliea maris]|nr:GspH/FimT family pseudopilin [Parahaliea maris]